MNALRLAHTIPADRRFSKLKSDYFDRQLQSLRFNPYLALSVVHNAVLSSLSIERTDERFLLAGSTDGSLFIYDLDQAPDDKDSMFGSDQVLDSLLSVERAQGGHDSAIANVLWYPLDTGIFTTSSTDGQTRVWDTNAMQAACTFSLGHPIYCHSLSSIGISHSLIATGGACPDIRLCDMRTGAASHTLRGHSGNIFAVQWSPRNEFLLASGSADKTIKLWDVRKGNAFLKNLDQRNEGSEGATAHNASVNGLVFTSDGLHLLSCGLDSEIRLWDQWTGRRTKTRYESIQNKTKTNVLPAIVSSIHQSLPYLFFPNNDRSILVANLFSGETVQLLDRAPDHIRCIALREKSQTLYSGGGARGCLVWSPLQAEPKSSRGRRPKDPPHNDPHDDDDDDGSNHGGDYDGGRALGKRPPPGNSRRGGSGAGSRQGSKRFRAFYVR
ncbi:WD40-repeat-containing domain protein [Polychytrium aggregatum]|uniref:WD40-repeat-containing domain protein n=1 Tax=Polychytrium aggregatum TaxID=110093 RepID=UPI0022FF24BC|nr:WD40-repeat-containing domain protein [Polychytrium aggregatum]KAI9209467.1 WD40-repeat-containing domain protein [Polychytrium aggregatum]